MSLKSKDLNSIIILYYAKRQHKQYIYGIQSIKSLFKKNKKLVRKSGKIRYIRYAHSLYEQKVFFWNISKIYPPKDPAPQWGSDSSYYWCLSTHQIWFKSVHRVSSKLFTDRQTCRRQRVLARSWYSAVAVSGDTIMPVGLLKPLSHRRTQDQKIMGGQEWRSEVNGFLYMVLESRDWW